MEGFGVLDQGCQAGARVVAGRLPIDDRRRIRLIAVTPRAPGSGSARRGLAMEWKVIDRMMRREGIVVMLQASQGFRPSDPAGTPASFWRALSVPDLSRLA